MASVGFGTRKPIAAGDNNMGGALSIHGHNIDLDAYMQHKDGKDLMVDYYSSITGANTERTLLDISDDTQQYVEVKNLVMRTTDALSITTYDGLKMTAVIDANIVPKTNDIILLNLINGGIGIFHVSDMSKKSYLDKYVYSIEMTFLYFKETAPDYYNNLISKIKKKYVYNSNHRETGSDPIVLASTYINVLNTRNTYYGLLDAYMNEFTNESIVSFNLDGRRYYDHMLTNLLFSIIGDGDHVNLHTLKMIDGIDVPVSILDDMMGVNHFKTSPMMYYNVNQITYSSSDESTMALLSSAVTNTISLNPVESGQFNIVGSVSTIIPNVYRDITKNTYIFSSEFYGDINVVDGYSILETAILSYMRGDPITIEDTIAPLVNDVSTWNTIERFYYIPLLLLILRYSEMNTTDRL